MMTPIQALAWQAGRLERSERSGRRRKPLVSHSMAVSQGWSDVEGGWFDWKGKNSSNYSSSLLETVIYRTERLNISLAHCTIRYHNTLSPPRPCQPPTLPGGYCYHIRHPRNLSTFESRRADFLVQTRDKQPLPGPARFRPRKIPNLKALPVKFSPIAFTNGEFMGIAASPFLNPTADRPKRRRSQTDGRGTCRAGRISAGRFRE